MGMTSKATTRQNERPKPPTWEEVSEDMTAAGDEDVVFTIGKEEERLIMPLGVSGTSSSSGILPGNKYHKLSESDSESSPPDQAKVQESCEKVSRLLNLYSQLKEVPTTLQEQYIKVKGMGEEMSKSINELKALSQTFSSESSSEHKKDAVEGSSKVNLTKQDSSTPTKSKAKHKKKT